MRLVPAEGGRLKTPPAGTLFGGQGYPNNPIPNAAVHRIEKTTRITIHISSCFMVLSPPWLAGFMLL
jgi:hypothetical protein